MSRTSDARNVLLYRSAIEAELLKNERKSWQGCFDAISESLDEISDQLMISAICYVDKQSGLPEFPITGSITFTQRVGLYRTLRPNCLPVIVAMFLLVRGHSRSSTFAQIESPYMTFC